ncbi:MAG: glycoside hydrolase family 78 protein [Chloroflexi bacterium]|nr:glycoside hydrolase family 78 protein [Chloroflexota bacterium]
MTSQQTPGPASAGGGEETAATIEALRFEHHPDGFAVGLAAPRLSWTVAAPGAWQQAAYEIELHNPGGGLRETTGRVESSESVLVTWPFAPLQSREQALLRVRAWSSDGQATDWGKLVPLEATLLAAQDWTARFVTPDWEEDTSKVQPAPFLRREFNVKAGVAQARLYITALGLYEAQLNGAVVGDHVLAPGWSSYNKRLRYQTFDVTGQLQEGPNVIGAALGDGWYRGRMGFGGGRINIYGSRLALLAQLEIKYNDGTTETVATDAGWRACTGPILASGIYDGETYDARRELDGWSKTGFDDQNWSGVDLIEWDLSKLVTPPGPPVRRTELVKVASISKSPSGKTLVDFGQNVVGRVRLTVTGEAGQTITLRHAEVLEHGELGVRPLRHARATDHYTLHGGGIETYEPLFTFHGFRYAEVEGWPGELKPADLVAVVCHSDMERTGWFESSDPLVNRLHENVVWGMRGNFLDVPTDCPQRDERLGWTGDIEVFTPTASFLFESAGFLTSWLADLAADQYANGVVPFVIPDIMDRQLPPMAAWSDAAVIVPWVLYQRFGDKAILAAQFESMKAWVDHLDRLTGEKRLWDEGFQFADWLDPDAPPDKPAAGKTNPDTVATAYFAYSADLLAKVAGVLGKKEEEAHYSALAGEVRQAFNNEYVTANGRIISDSTTVYSMALEFALLPDAHQREYAGKRLAALARESGYHISTGFVGTPLICDALCQAGEYEVAYRLLMQRENPSWLYPVTMGATTIWERWDSMLPDGTINPGEMTSFNHYALGAVADWLHRVVGGLAPAAPGYKKLTIRPVPGGGLTSARARHITPYGLAESAWKLADGQFQLDAIVPPNTTATVVLPGHDGEALEVGPGAHHWVYAYQAPVREKGQISLESQLLDLDDDPEVKAVIVRTLRRFVPDFAQSIEDGLPGGRNMTLREALFILPNSERCLAELERELAEYYRQHAPA